MTDEKKEKKIVPICSYCQKIRDQKGIWQIADKSISQEKEISLSHSICPECRKKFYKGM